MREQRHHAAELPIRRGPRSVSRCAFKLYRSAGSARPQQKARVAVAAHRDEKGAVCGTVTYARGGEQGHQRQCQPVSVPDCRM